MKHSEVKIIIFFQVLLRRVEGGNLLFCRFIFKWLQLNWIGKILKSSYEFEELEFFLRDLLFQMCCICVWGIYTNFPCDLTLRVHFHIKLSDTLALFMPSKFG